jgi:hypothetical protein
MTIRNKYPNMEPKDVPDYDEIKKYIGTTLKLKAHRDQPFNSNLVVEVKDWDGTLAQIQIAVKQQAGQGKVPREEQTRADGGAPKMNWSVGLHMATTCIFDDDEGPVPCDSIIYFAWSLHSDIKSGKNPNDYQWELKEPLILTGAKTGRFTKE